MTSKSLVRLLLLLSASAPVFALMLVPPPTAAGGVICTVLENTSSRILPLGNGTYQVTGASRIVFTYEADVSDYSFGAGQYTYLHDYPQSYFNYLDYWREWGGSEIAKNTVAAAGIVYCAGPLYGAWEGEFPSRDNPLMYSPIIN